MPQLGNFSAQFIVRRNTRIPGVDARRFSDAFAESRKVGARRQFHRQFPNTCVIENAGYGL
jgi:hypothetical protein